MQQVLLHSLRRQRQLSDKEIIRFLGLARSSQPFLCDNLYNVFDSGKESTDLIITSRDNPNVKRIAKLAKRDNARDEGVIYLEGTRLCEEALSSGQKAIEVIVSEDKISWAERFTPDIEPLVLSRNVFTKISQTVNPQGVAIVIKEPELSADIPSNGRDIYVVLENTQDPGNLGTIIRMADAFGLTAVIVSPTTCDPYNDKVIRATMGSVWHIPIVRKTMDECFDFFGKNGTETLAR